MLQKNALLILTDSGGLQEEACILQTPCVTLRENTERPETVNVSANIIAGISEKGILNACSKQAINLKDWENPFGNGQTSKKIIELTTQFLRSKTQSNNS